MSTGAKHPRRVYPRPAVEVHTMQFKSGVTVQCWPDFERASLTSPLGPPWAGSFAELEAAIRASQAERRRRG